MSMLKIRRLSARAEDDKLLPLSKKDLSGGVNSRQSGTNISDNQSTVLTNVDISIPSETSKRLGSVLTANDVSNNTFAALHNYERQGYTDVMVAYDDINLWEWIGSDNWLSATASGFTTGKTDVGIINAKESGLVPDDVIIIQNTSDTARRYHKDSSNAWAVEDLLDANESPPKTSVMCWYANRVWALANDLLYFSDAYPASYASAFDRTTNIFRLPVGAERGLAPIRSLGIVVMGENEIWAIAPSLVPSATSDQPQPLVTEHGIVSKNGWVSAGDDIYYFATDGLRALKRTVSDKVQAGVSYPLSYALKDQFDAISWGNISNLEMVYFDNKIIISVPTSATEYDIWVYYPSMESFTIFSGWTPRHWAKYKVSGEERLYYSTISDGVMYRALYGFTDEGTTTTNGTAITYTEEGREEDFKHPMEHKSGGEIEVVAQSTSSGLINVYISLNNNGYQKIGDVNLDGSSFIMPFTFPVIFSTVVKVRNKFHLEPYGRFKTIKYKLENTTVNTAVITILERNLTTYLEEYENE